MSLSMSSISACAGARQPRLGVAHRRRPVAVHRAEVALALDQRQPHREVLRHAHQRVVDRLIAVRMVLAHHVADDARRLAERLVVGVAALVHGEEDAPVHRLQPVAHVGQGAGDDHAHRVVEIGALHLLLDGDEAEIGAGRHDGRSGQEAVLAAAADDAGAKNDISTRGNHAQLDAIAWEVCEKRAVEEPVEAGIGADAGNTKLDARQRAPRPPRSRCVGGCPPAPGLEPAEGDHPPVGRAEEAAWRHRRRLRPPIHADTAADPCRHGRPVEKESRRATTPTPETNPGSSSFYASRGAVGSRVTFRKPRLTEPHSRRAPSRTFIRQSGPLIYIRNRPLEAFAVGTPPRRGIE